MDIPPLTPCLPPLPIITGRIRGETPENGTRLPLIILASERQVVMGARNLFLGEPKTIEWWKTGVRIGVVEYTMFDRLLTEHLFLL